MSKQYICCTRRPTLLEHAGLASEVMEWLNTTCSAVFCALITLLARRLQEPTLHLLLLLMHQYLGLKCDLVYSLRFSAMKLVLLLRCYCVSVTFRGVRGVL